MKIHFGQIYIEPGVFFPFSCLFQRLLSDEVSALLEPSTKFIQRYGADWELVFRISAKRAIPDNEIRGPSVFKKDKDVEFTIFLPFDVIRSSASAIEFLLQGVCTVLASLGFDTTQIRSRQASLAECLSSDPRILEPGDRNT